MADDGWTTVGAPKKKAEPKPKATGQAAKPSPLNNPKPVGGTKSYGPSASFLAATSSGTGKTYAAPVSTQKSHTTVSSATARKIEEQADSGESALHVKKISHTMSESIQRARTAKNWTQKELAQAIGESHLVVRDYENGNATPNKQILNKMEKALGTKIH